MVVFPALTPVTNPVLDTVPFAGVPETHALLAAAVPLPVSCKVAPTHSGLFPLMVGFGFTVYVYVCGVPVHPACVGVTVIVPVIGLAVALLVVNTAMLPVPLAASPMLVFELTHE